MHFDTLMLLFPVILGVHNYEESHRLDEFVLLYHSRLRDRLTRRPVALTAFVVVTAASAVVSLLTFRYGTPALRILARIAVFVLFLNALGHVSMSLVRRTFVPGTGSAIALVLPFSGLAIYAMHADLGDTFRALAGYAALGAAATPVIILAALLCGLLANLVLSRLHTLRI
jgi:hypothetical protein